MYTNPAKPELIYQDDALIVVNKPWNLLSVPGLGDDKKDCLVSRLQADFPTVRIVHRLDFATSGVMVLALNADSHRALSMQFQHRQTGKRYQAVVNGKIRDQKGEIDLPLRCDWENRPLQMVCREHGKPAQTHWKVLEQSNDRSRVSLTPITGRSHQLRVHMLSIGHCILGDEFYGSAEIRQCSDRLLLHAEMLSFQHPETGKSLSFESTCPF